MADAAGICALYGLFDPLDRQVLSKPAPVGRRKVVCQEVKGIVEHCDES
ncbi:MAG: hypothetical protein H7335_09855, partial [Massilia sp.]|nr:hypothetical protein [Massilia sp.]